MWFLLSLVRDLSKGMEIEVGVGLRDLCMLGVVGYENGLEGCLESPQ